MQVVSPGKAHSHVPVPERDARLPRSGLELSLAKEMAV